MAEVYSQDISVKTDIKGLPKNSDALSQLTRAIGHNIAAIKGLTTTLQKAGNKAVNAAQNNNQKLVKPVQELEKAGSKAAQSLTKLTSKMKEFGSRVHENWQSFKRLMGIMKSVVLVGGAVSVVFGAIIAVLANAQSKKREATASHFMSAKKLDALKYAEGDLKTDGQVLQMLDAMGQAVLDPENYGAFKTLHLDPDKFRRLDAKGRYEYAAPILKQQFQGLSDADISKNDLVFKPFAQIAGDPSFGRQLFGTRDASGRVQEGIADDVSKQWNERLKYTSKIDYVANAKAAKDYNVALNNLQITFDTFSAAAAPSVTKALEALNSAFKMLEPTLLKLIDTLPHFIDQLAGFLRKLGINLLDSVSSNYEAVATEPEQTSATGEMMSTAKKMGVAFAAGAAAGSVVPGVGTLVGGAAAALGTGVVDAGLSTGKDIYLRNNYGAVSDRVANLNRKASLLVDKQEGNLSFYDPAKYAVNATELKTSLGKELQMFGGLMSHRDPSRIQVELKVEDHRVKVRLTDKTTSEVIVSDMLLGGK